MRTERTGEILAGRHIEIRKIGIKEQKDRGKRERES